MKGWFPGGGHQGAVFHCSLWVQQFPSSVLGWPAPPRCLCRFLKGKASSILWTLKTPQIFIFWKLLGRKGRAGLPGCLVTTRHLRLEGPLDLLPLAGVKVSQQRWGLCCLSIKWEVTLVLGVGGDPAWLKPWDPWCPISSPGRVRAERWGKTRESKPWGASCFISPQEGKDQSGQRHPGLSCLLCHGDTLPAQPYLWDGGLCEVLGWFMGSMEQ